MAVQIVNTTMTSGVCVYMKTLLDDIGIFDDVDYDVEAGEVVKCYKDSKKLFEIAFTSGRADYSWYNANGSTIYTGYGNGFTTASIAKCGASLIMAMMFGGASYDFVFGKTKQGNVYMGFTYNHSSSLTAGQCISMCENTPLNGMIENPFYSTTSSYWTRTSPICVLSSIDDGVEFTTGLYGFIERQTSIPLYSSSNPVLTDCTINGKRCITDGSFLLEDSAIS